MFPMPVRDVLWLWCLVSSIQRVMLILTLPFTACQHADWPAHKTACRAQSLSSGQWITLNPVVTSLPGWEEDVHSMINRFSGQETPEQLAARTYVPGLTDKSPPPNVWGSKPFLVKIQIQLCQDPTNAMLYDRKLSFRVFFRAEDGVDTFGELLRELRSERAELPGAKMYRWARRTGDWEFSVCLDRKPTVNAQW